MIRALVASFGVLILFPVLSGGQVPQTAKDFQLIKGALGTEAGDYSFFSMDKTVLQKEYIDRLKQIGPEDAAYFQTTVNSIEETFRRLRNDIIFRKPGGVSYDKKRTFTDGGLVWMSNQFKAEGTGYPSGLFLDRIAEFEQAEDDIKGNITRLTEISNGALPTSLDINADGSGLKKLPVALSDIKFGVIIQKYSDALRGYRLAMANLPQYMILKGGLPDIIKPNTGRSLAVAESEFVLPPPAIKKMRDEVRSLRDWNHHDREDLDEFTDYTKEMILSFVKTYKQRYRSQNQEELNSFVLDAKYIELIFWARCYLRMAFGVQIGAIGIDYAQEPFGLDLFTVTNAALSQVNVENVWFEKEYFQMKQNYRNALNRTKDRMTPVDGNLTSLREAAHQLESLITFVAGNRNLVKALNAMLTLMAADLYEDTLVVQMDGVPLMKQRYRDRWLNTPERKAMYIAIRKRWDPKPSDEVDPNAPPMQNSGQVAGEFTKTRDKLRDKNVDLFKALKLEQTILMAQKNAPFEQARNSRVEDAEK